MTATLRSPSGYRTPSFPRAFSFLAFAIAWLIVFVPFFALNEPVAVFVMALLAGIADIRGALHGMYGGVFFKVTSFGR